MTDAHRAPASRAEDGGAQSWASSLATRKSMLSNRGRDTGPERALRSALHRAGYRYRVCSRPIRDLRRTADLVFVTARLAVFVDGCYWHGCPEHYEPPRANATCWRTKVEQNVSRDRETNRILRDARWRVVRIWEHEPLSESVAKVIAALR